MTTGTGTRTFINYLTRWILCEVTRNALFYSTGTYLPYPYVINLTYIIESQVVVTDGDVSLSPSVNKLLATTPPVPSIQTYLVCALARANLFMYSILDYSLKLTSTNRGTTPVINKYSHEHTIVLRTMPNVLLQCVRMDSLLKALHTHILNH